MSHVIGLARPVHHLSGRRKWRAAATAVLGFALLLTGCARPPALGQDYFTTAGHRAHLAPFHHADFHHSTVITNPFFPVVPGTKWRWKGQYRGLPYVQADWVPHYTRLIDGVVTQPVIDEDIVSGRIIAGSIDYYAQDDQGNVWYLGETTSHYVNGKLTDHADSWIAGRKGALPGIFMPAHPALRSPHYQQEYAPNLAADVARVINTSASTCVPLHCFQDTVEFLETSVLNPGVVSAKYYAPGVGLIKENTLAGDPYAYGLVSVRLGSGASPQAETP